MKISRPLIIHPFLFAIFPVISLYAQNVRERSFDIIVVPATGMIGFAIVALLISRLLLKSYYKAGIVVSIFIILIFSYGPVWSMIEGVRKGSFFIIQHRYLISGWAFFFISCLYCIARTKRVLIGATKVLNVVAVITIAVPTLNILTYFATKKEYIFHDHQYLPEHESPKVRSTPGTLPDVYYIILDRYASAWTLREIYNFDNSEFINHLSDKGFYIASESRSNYLKTGHSLASSLNFEFINYLSKSVGEDSADWNPLFNMIKNNKIVHFLKKHGYQYIHVGSYWGPTRRNESADKNISFLLLSRFSYLLYTNTLLYPFLLNFDAVPLKEFNRQHWESTIKVFDALSEIPYMNGPKFIFAHIILPHPPFIFDRYGNFTNDDFVPPTDITDLGVKEKELKRKYIEQLMYTNKKVTELVDRILSRSTEVPVIIIQADEGPWPIRYYYYKDHFNWNSQATDRELKEKTGILNAFYLPNKNYKGILYPSITPVNTFRIILNAYFNQHLQLLPDETYAHEDDKHIYKLFSVMGRVK